MKRTITAILASLLLLPSIAQTREHVLPEAEHYFAKADSLRDNRDYANALNCAFNARDLYEDTFGSESAEFGVAMGRTAEYMFWCEGDWEPELKRGLQIVSSSKGTQCDEYARLLTLFAKYDIGFDESSQRMEHAKQAVDIRREVLGTQHPDYAFSVAVLGECYNDCRLYEAAIPLLSQAVTILRDYETSHCRQLGKSLNELYKSYRLSGKHDDGLSTLSEILDLQTRQFGRDHKWTTRTMMDLANYYSQQGKELEAYRLKEELNRLTSQSQQQTSFTSIKYLQQLAVSHESRGRTDLAIPLYERILGICEKKLQADGASVIDSMDVAKAAEILSFAHERAGNYMSSMQIANKAVSIWDGIGLNKDTIYVGLINRIALCLYRMELYDRAMAFAKHGIAILDDNPDAGCQNLTYVNALRILSWSEAKEGMTNEAAQHARRALDILEQEKLRQSREYVYCQYELAERMLYADDVKGALGLYESALKGMKDIVVKSFTSQSAQERQTTWNKLQSVFHSAYPRFCFNYNQTKSRIEDASVLYDYSALFAKGLMLTMETGLNERIRHYGNQSLKAKLDTLQDMRSELANLYEHPNAQQASQAVALAQQVEYREKEVVLMLKNAGLDYTAPLQTTWRDVQKSLGPGDIAVEFITFPMDYGDDVTIALTLRQDDPCPKMKPIFDSWGLKYTESGNIYEDPVLYDIVWGSLLDRLDGIKNIYFAPSGPLHNLGIESLPGCEHFNFYRLSSTRELVKRQRRARPQNAVLYGGLLYDADLAEIRSESQSYRKDNPYERTSYDSRNIIDTLRVRGASAGTPYLKGTETEVDAIARLAADTKVNVSVLKGIRGSEESFKALSGEKVQLVHIATHGFYWTEYTPKMYGGDLTGDAIPLRSREDKALSRSGLLMAGADNALEGDMADDLEDGLLTAQEIAQLDFTHIDMATLSACETALGDISKSEGIFGLQRGFKKAGVNSILMSLWKVDDEATCLLMTEFYKNWLGGRTKHDALERAKSVVRSHKEKGWDDPKYWAAFILLDGLD